MNKSPQALLGQKPTTEGKTGRRTRLRVPREFICLIGGPTNTFNGWYTSVYRPADPDDFILVGGPPPRTREDVRFYINFQVKAYDVNPSDKQEMRKHGWWSGSYQAVLDKGWLPTEVVAFPGFTHDIFWGNFAVSAYRLYSSDKSLSSPMIRPKPLRGDIVTFLVYAPAYDKREKIDYAASPYNFKHKDKYISEKSAAADYWKWKPSTNLPPLPPIVTRPSYRTPTDLANEAKNRELISKELEAEKKRAISEDDVNFYILMATTRDRDAKYLNRIKGYDSYRGWFRYYPDCGPDVMEKVIFFNTPQEFINYVKTGQFSGTEGEDYDMIPPRPVTRDIYGRPLKCDYTWFKHWDATPGVDRSKIRICRFDYFGHSDANALMLEYGWKNKKGEPPDADVTLTISELKDAFETRVLTPDAHASLWGCNLGDTSFGSAIGTQLTSIFGGGVCAADQTTQFSKILDNDNNMPFPFISEWDSIQGIWAQREVPFKLFPYSP